MVFVLQAEDGIRDLVRSRGLGDVYKRQVAAFGLGGGWEALDRAIQYSMNRVQGGSLLCEKQGYTCLLYTSDAADERSSVDLGGRRIIKKKKRRGVGVVGEDDTQLQIDMKSS